MLLCRQGTIFVTHYSVMHRKGESTCEPCVRNMLKYCYFRKAPPRRDWVEDPEFDLLKTDFGTHYYPNGMGAVRNSKFAVEMFMWLCNRPMPRLVGGQAWPGGSGSLPNFIAPQYGMPDELKVPLRFGRLSCSELYTLFKCTFERHMEF